MTHRPPTAADIGKQVEVSQYRDFASFRIGTLVRIEIDADGTWYDVSCSVPSYEFCRVPYSTPDPIAELSMAADLLAERGADEAARVLMLWLSLAEVDRQRLNLYRDGDSITVWFSFNAPDLRTRRLFENQFNPEPQP